MNVYYGEIDKAILPAITLLNEKGYATSACCSGHADSGHNPEIAYIQFGFGEITPETLPDGWIWVANDQMEYTYSSVDTNELDKEIENVVNALFLWAKELPCV